MPKGLIGGFERAISVTAQFPPLLLQVALADFIREGHFASHIRQMRRLYSKRKAVFLKACREQLDPWLELSEIEAGMQLVERFNCEVDDGDLHAAARARGVDFTRLSKQ